MNHPESSPRDPSDPSGAECGKNQSGNTIYKW